MALIIKTQALKTKNRAAAHSKKLKTGKSTTSQNATSNLSLDNGTSAIVANTSLAALEKKSSPYFGLSSGNIQKNGVYFGFLPDEGDAGGTRQTMAQINSALGAKSAAYGWYAQAKSGTTFDGSQLLAVIDDVKACNCVFQPAVMPTGGWKGLTSSDNSQAIAIANVMKKFTDRGIPVWLRFAHEVNYYQTDGTYSGTASDFQAGWAVVAAACKKIAPEVKMWWTPNVADASNYAKYAPTDMSTVHLVGVDYYPKSLSTGTEFVNTMKKFHDTYAVQGRMFAIGETGIAFSGSDSDKVSWLKQILSAKSSLPNMIACAWFNFQKDFDYRIVIPGGSSLTTTVKSVLV
ncbi:family 26 glycoside hydrolase [Phakopsora pachyrhizi]|uniref:Family 26 glycoside hydrolase n=1 Tax=Phakopsora pachyrhizi TaxID=170000 RepID=A0AAV0BT79_PHAPC|nr:family 26 glycoside hydrolase [Phakopsora pachyrhizi]CAH7690685.1 family 26 glycoside hydrolase [Phakopsora pachyrhizi]